MPDEAGTYRFIGKTAAQAEALQHKE